MSVANGERTRGSLSPEALFNYPDLLNGFAQNLQSRFEISVNPSEILPQGKKVVYQNGYVNIKMPFETAYKIALVEAIKIYLDKNKELPPAIVVYEINGKAYAPTESLQIINPKQLPEKITDLEKIYGELQNIKKVLGYTFKYMARGKSVGDAKIDPKTLEVVRW